MISNWLVIPFLVVTSVVQAQTKPSLVVGVASNALPAFEELSKEFTSVTSVAVTLSSGATGLLGRQLREGAPFDVFVSADTSTVQALAADRLVRPETVRVYAQGQLVVFQSDDTLPRLTSLAELTSSTSRIALPNPETAPYGAAAREALRAVGVWDTVQPRVVIAENVAAAVQMARSGNVDYAFTAASLALAGGRSTVVYQKYYTPIRQSLAVSSASNNTSQALQFCDFVCSDRSSGVIAKHGYKVSR